MPSPRGDHLFFEMPNILRKRGERNFGERSKTIFICIMPTFPWKFFEKYASMSVYDGFGWRVQSKIGQDEPPCENFTLKKLAFSLALCYNEINICLCKANRQRREMHG